MTLLEQAKAFREAFGQDMQVNISTYGFINSRLWNMQANLVAEESSEFLAAVDEVYADPENNKRRAELLKELCDLVFVCYQFAAAFNLDLDTAMQRVFDSNMSKLGEDGKPIYRADGKVLKGPNYAEPNLDHLFPKANIYFDTNGK